MESSQNIKIPIQFDHAGKHYIGHFTAPHGAGGKVWFLTIDRFHRGQLMHTENFGWQFYNKDGTMKELTDYFAEVVTAWYE
jgi:hypothetical protein